MTMETGAQPMLNDAELSRVIAREAGARLLELRESFGVIDPADRKRADLLRKEGDREAQKLLAAALAEHRPDDAILSEEADDDDRRLTAERVWIIDPLDGTWEFGQSREDFAVHVALWHASSQTLSACTVDLPAQGMTRSVLDEVTGPGALPSDRPLRVVASRTRPPASLGAAIEILSKRLADSGVSNLGVEIIDVGSVGAKVNTILSGRAEAYVHDTGFYEWDVAAPFGVARHYGFEASHVDGRAMAFNQMPPFVTDLVVSHPMIATDLRASLAQAARS
jgi:3'(2'), 5'-bisphosphate nucleotidase